MKLFLLLTFLGVVLWGGYWGASKAYETITRARLSDWHVKTVVVSGVTDPLEQELASLAQPYQGQPFTIKQAVSLRQEIMRQYPMLKDVGVKRGLLSGKLTISAKHRVPVAQFVRPEGNIQYIDADATVYADANPGISSPLVTVELMGEIPEQLNPEFIELVSGILKLGKDLSFALLRMNLNDNTVSMHLADGNEIDFGPAVQLKNKVSRAAQIVPLARQKCKGTFKLDFKFFENGKVFLTQTAR